MQKSGLIATVEYVEKTAVMTVNTDIISDRQVDSLRELIINTVLQRNCRYVILDFVKSRLVSTSLMGLLLRIQKKLHGKQIRIILSCLDCSKLTVSESDRYAYEIFRVLDFRKLFDICNRPAQAIAERIAIKDSQMDVHAKDGSSSQTAMAY